MIAAAMILGSGQTRAEFVTVAALAECDGVNQRMQLVENRIPSAGAGETWHPQLDTDDPHDSLGFFSILRNQSLSIRNIASCGISDGSSRSVSSNDPSSSLAGSLPNPQVPPLELTRLLSPPTGVNHPICMPFFLFRPPRAV
jgi:hypothetical protein